MSKTVDYFFNCTDSLSTIAEQMRMSVGCSLLPYEGDPNDFYCRFLGMDLDLQKTSFENDGEMNFEDYTFHLSLRTSVGLAPLREIQIPSMAFIAYALRFRSHIAGMLVFDGQVLLARYEERLDPDDGEANLYDTISDQFVKFPSHLSTLMNRIPEDYEFYY